MSPLFISPHHMTFDQNTFPDATNVVDLTTVKNHLRVEHNTDNTLITSLITVAQDIVQKYTGAFLQKTTVTFYFDKISDFMDLHVGPEVTIVDGDVTYKNSNGGTTSVSASDYQLDGKRYPARLRFTSTPSDVKDELNAVQIQCSAGYQSDLPEALKSAMLLIIGHLYENRQDVTRFQHYEIPMSSQYLMNPYRLKSFK